MFKLDVNVPKDKPVVGVRTTNHRGFTPDELAEQCMEKVISVSDNAHPGIRDQARAFSKHIEKLIHKGWITKIKYYSDLNYVISSSLDGMIHIHDIENLEYKDNKTFNIH